jgi:hypothetical protein
VLAPARSDQFYWCGVVCWHRVDDGLIRVVHKIFTAPVRHGRTEQPANSREIRVENGSSFRAKDTYTYLYFEHHFRPGKSSSRTESRGVVGARCRGGRRHTIFSDTNRDSGPRTTRIVRNRLRRLHPRQTDRQKCLDFPIPSGKFQNTRTYVRKL